MCAMSVVPVQPKILEHSQFSKYVQREHEMSTNLVKLTFCKMTRVRRKLLSLLMLKGAECVALELR